jgi:hypothetical protein
MLLSLSARETKKQEAVFDPSSVRLSFLHPHLFVCVCISSLRQTHFFYSFQFTLFVVPELMFFVRGSKIIHTTHIQKKKKTATTTTTTKKKEHMKSRDQD